MKHVLLSSLLLSSLANATEQEPPPQLPALELDQLPVVEFSLGKPFLRNLTEEEVARTRSALFELRLKSDVSERELLYGDCFNNSGRWAGIYGPNISGRPYDNDLYMVPPGYKTPDGWDCDGFFVPSDVYLRMVTSAVTFTERGPGAVKIRNNQWLTLESLAPLQRTVSAIVLDWIGPGNPTNWYRPGFPQQDLDDLGDTWRPKPPASR